MTGVAGKKLQPRRRYRQSCCPSRLLQRVSELNSAVCSSPKSAVGALIQQQQDAEISFDAILRKRERDDSRRRATEPIQHLPFFYSPPTSRILGFLFSTFIILAFIRKFYFLSTGCCCASCFDSFVGCALLFILFIGSANGFISK